MSSNPMSRVSTMGSMNRRSPQVGICNEFQEEQKHESRASFLSVFPPGPQKDAWQYIFKGEDYRLSQDINLAIKYLNIAKKINEKVRSQKVEALILECLSLSYRGQDKYEEAISHAKEAIVAYSELGETGELGKGHAHVILGVTLKRLGRFDEAIRFVKKGLVILLKAHEYDFAGQAYSDLSVCYNEIKEHEKARKCGKKAWEIAIKTGSSYEIGRSLHNIGEAYYGIGKVEEAIKHCEKGAAIFNEANDKKSLSLSYGVLGNYYSSLGDTKTAADYYKKCIDINSELQQYTDMAIACGNVGEFYNRVTLDLRTFLSFGKPINECFENSVKYLKLAIEKTNDKLFEMSVDRNKTAFAERFYHWHVKLTEPILRTGRIEAALLVLDLGKAKALKILLDRRMDTPLRQDLSWSSIEEGKEKERIRCVANEIQLQHSDSTVLFYSFNRGDRLTIWTVDVNGNVFSEWRKPESDLPPFRFELEHYISSLLKLMSLELPREYSFYTPATNDDRMQEEKRKNTPQVERKPGSGPSVTNVSGQQSTQNVLQSEEATCASKGGYCIGKTSNSSKIKKAGVDVDAVDKETRSSSKKELWKLYHVLIGPVKAKIRGAKLIIVPHGCLFFAPFSAINDESGCCLSENYEIQIVPSIHSLASSMKVPASRIGGLLFVGNPSVGTVRFGGEPLTLSSLPSATEEVSYLASLFGVKPLTDASATKRNVLKLMPDASIIHIAAHGEDKFGHIFLAPDLVSRGNLPTERSYLLSQKDILQRKLSARLVVLSCCYTGRGQTTSEGVLGIARSFLGAGARAVLMTLWKIEDQFTMEFMKEFYSRFSEGISACKALKETTNLFQKNDTYGDFSFWAAFEILGEDVRFTKEEIEEMRKKNKEM